MAVLLQTSALEANWRQQNVVPSLRKQKILPVSADDHDTEMGGVECNAKHARPPALDNANSVRVSSEDQKALAVVKGN
jgi:hypothetical protein